MKINGQGLLSIVRDVGFERITYLLTEADGEYGLSVSCRNSGECTAVDGITSDISVAKKLCKLFAEHTVFPANVLEIFDDLLATGIDLDTPL